MPTLVLLIRHALTDTAGKRLSGWSRGVHLNDRGREQAERLADRLDGIPIRAIYASDLERCLESAEPLARKKGLDVQPVGSLRDVDYGRWTGRAISQLVKTKQWARLMTTVSGTRFPDGETLREVQDRVVAEVDRIAEGHPRSTVAVISHADPIRLLLAHFGGVHVDLFQRLVVHPASVSAVAVGDGAPHILKVNDTGDLSDLAPPRRPPPSGRNRP